MVGIQVLETYGVNRRIDTVQGLRLIPFEPTFRDRMKTEGIPIVHSCLEVIDAITDLVYTT
ncbi:MAG: hypothetical protein EA417_14435 [Gammaproteobacteria bacterium]|nr:MAG: hypothetical protein EA417_14435 [Gammaproteobacteria bacterium]